MFRIITILFIILAFIAGVADIFCSFIEGYTAPESLGRIWIDFSPNTLGKFRMLVIENLHPFVWDMLIREILEFSGWIVFGVLAILSEILHRIEFGFKLDN